MPRLASLYLPDLALDRIRRSERRRAPPSAPRRPDADRVLPAPTDGWRPGARWAREDRPQDFVLHADGAGALVTAHKSGNQNLLAACRAGRSALGLAPGMPLTKARILVPGLDVRAADLEGDAAWLLRLGLFAARRWTPRAAPSGPDGLWLDLTGVSPFVRRRTANVRAHPRLRETAGFHRPHRRRGHDRRGPCPGPLRRRAAHPLPRRRRGRRHRGHAARRAAAG